MRVRGPLLVSAGIIYREGRVLIGQRRAEDRHPLKWEFPGGKVEAGETPQEALVRELQEELSIDSEIGGELARYQHDYPNGSRVHLLFFAVLAFTGEPRGKIYDQIQWAELAALPEIDFLDGDFDFVRRLARGDFAAQLSNS